MFEDILGKEKEIKKPKNRVNVMPKGLAKAKKDAMKRAMKIRKELSKVKKEGVSPI